MLYALLIILLFLLSFNYDIKGNSKYYDVWYNILLIFFILFAGLRWRLMWDTASYLSSFYHLYPPLDEFSFADYPIGKDPFYVLLNSIVKSYGGRFYIVQLIHATFINVLVFRYLKKHCKYIFTCLLFYAIICYFNLSMEIMRGSISIVICLFANDYFLEKKWLKGYILLLFGLMFHSQTLIMFVTPIAFFLKLNKKGIILFVIAFLIGRILQGNFGDLFMLFNLGDTINGKVDTYASSDYFSGQGGNINHIILHILPNLVYAIFSLYYVKRKKLNKDLLKMEPLMMIGILLMFIQINLQIVYRIVDYYSIYFVLFFAETFIAIVNKYKTKRMQPSKVAFMCAMIIFLPFFLLWGTTHYLNRWTFYPYSSVIERSIHKDREQHLMENNNHSADRNEY